MDPHARELLTALVRAATRAPRPAPDRAPGHDAPGHEAAGHETVREAATPPILPALPRRLARVRAAHERAGGRPDVACHLPGRCVPDGGRHPRHCP